ncbi:MAG: response regulator [Oscillospiraceae bacterium]|jgi:two-component system sensor histidine kinase/response regulator|nr:response regulator [Oscillospiraceae bacterium]
MKNKTTRFLVVSLALAVTLCIGLFGFLSSFMNRRSADAINQVGQFYMKNLSEQISLHFQTTIGLRLEQVEALAIGTPPAQLSGKSHEAILDELGFNAQARGFSYLALLSPAGDFEMVYGSELSITDPGPFLSSLQNGDTKVAVGTDANGARVLLLGVPANYCMSAGDDALALVAALPVDYITSTLSLEEDASKTYSYIIRQDGSFVIRTGDAYRSSYFDRALSLYKDVNGQTPEEFVSRLQAAMATGEPYSTQFQIGGERRNLYCAKLAYSEWYLLTAMPFGDLNSSIDQFSHMWSFVSMAGCIFVLALLITIFVCYLRMSNQQLQELETARKDAERANRAKSEFLSNMSHDIRTPMNAIVGMTAIATANQDDPEQVQNCLKKIALSSKHLLGLINDVLDMSKIESGKMTLSMDQVSLREVMESIVDIVQPQMSMKQQHFNVSIHDVSTESVFCDSVRLNQVLLNLASNAIKFTPDGGEIELSLYEEPSPKGDAYVRIHLSVRDNGIGMTPEFQATIFESFTREDNTRVHRTEGTGLGMAITKYIVDAMGGSIELDSAPGEGTEFRVTLDLEKAELSEEEMVLPNWNMLVVDDNQQLCDSAVTALRSIGVNAEYTLDGESALNLVLERRVQGKNYHIILMDWKLPGIDGLETARRIRTSLGDDVPILLISAYDWSEIEEDATQAGITGFISKPLFKSTLYHGLRAFADPAAGPLAPAETFDLTGRRVLLAEDNELNWEIAHDLLEELGLELDWAENGQIAVERFQGSAPGYYDAVLMDIRMPVMNGYEATRAIRALDREDAGLPIIAMTADAFAEDVKRCLDAGMNAHIAKPIDVREVARLLEKFLRP